ncbi:MAG: pyrroline-5-carboxylate reductase [Phycisphaerales bacterium]|nr:pyrroline-5-carboxylate reductase [Phycisphaerales bacterium]
MSEKRGSKGGARGSTPALAIIGGGNMARAIYDGGVRRGVLDPERVVVADPDPAKRERFAHAAPTAMEAIERLEGIEQAAGRGVVLLAIKPQALAGLGEELGGRLSDSGRAVLSILAGTPSGKVHRTLGPGLRVVRVMPNTPVSIGLGMSAVAVGDGAKEEDAAVAEKLFSAIGEVVRIGEQQMDAFTAVAGSGPAYVFYLAEAMAAAAARMGFDPETAEQIVRQTVAGASGLMEQSGQEPGALRRAVTSPGGTTAAAIGVMEESGMFETVVEALRAAKARGAELAREG